MGKQEWVLTGHLPGQLGFAGWTPEGTGKVAGQAGNPPEDPPWDG